MAVKQEQINLQHTAHRDCTFCADPSHFMGSCPLVEGYIQAGKASRGTDSCLYLLGGWRIPHVQGTRCLHECLDWLPALVPAPPSSIVTSGIFSVTNSTTDTILDIEPSVFMAPVDQDSDEELDPALADPDFRRTSPTLGLLSRPIGRTKGSESNSTVLRCRLERLVVQVLRLHRWPRK